MLTTDTLSRANHVKHPFVSGTGTCGEPNPIQASFVVSAMLKVQILEHSIIYPLFFSFSLFLLLKLFSPVCYAFS